MIVGSLCFGLIGGVSLAQRHLDKASNLQTAMTTAQAHKAAGRKDILLVDIRRPSEWRRTGIGQFATPIDLRDPAFITKIRAAQSSADQPVALICARGVRSAKTSARLTEAGFANVVDVPAGMLGSRAGPGWLKSNLPIVRYEK